MVLTFFLVLLLSTYPIPMRGQTDEILVLEREMYMQCNGETDSGCIAFSESVSCFEDRSCEVLLQYQAEPENAAFQFQMLFRKKRGKRYPKNFYLAVGFGDLPAMINNSVVGCFRYKNKTNIHLSKNTQSLNNHPAVGQEHLARDVLFSDKNDFRFLAADHDEKFYCSFKLEMAFQLGGLNFALNSHSYHILFAWGRALSLKKMAYHFPNQCLMTQDSISLWRTGPNKVSHPESGAHYDILRFHIWTFVFSYFFLIPTSNIVSRFFKESLIHERRVCNRRVWFAIHMTQSSLAIIIVIWNVFSTEAYFMRYKIATAKAKLHYQFGIAVLISTALASIMGVLVGCVNPLSCLRHSFSFLHCIVGNIAYLMGVIQIFMSVSTMPLYLKYCSWAEALCVGWIIFHAISYFVLTCIMFRRDRIDVNIQELIRLEKNMMLKSKQELQSMKAKSVRTKVSTTGHRHSKISSKTFDINDGSKTLEQQQREVAILEKLNYQKMILTRILSGKEGQSHDKLVGSRRRMEVGSNINRASTHRSASRTRVSRPGIKKPRKRSKGKKAGGGQSLPRNTSKIHFKDQIPSDGPKQSMAAKQDTKAPLPQPTKVGPTGGKDEDDLKELIPPTIIQIPSIDEEDDDEDSTSDGNNPEEVHKYERPHAEDDQPEDPDDYLNNFHHPPLPLDEYRAFRQYPIHPNNLESANTKLYMLFLGIFYFVSLATSLVLCFLLYADVDHPGCQFNEKFLFFQQWHPVDPSKNTTD